MSYIAARAKAIYYDKKVQVVLFSSTAIALYGYDQGMMSMINTNYDYLDTMGIAEDSAIVGVIVSVYYLGCALGAVLFSWYADRFGRKKAIFLCLTTASLGNLIMFLAGIGGQRGALAVMLTGRVIMGLGVGGVDSVIPVYSAELASDEARGKALAQEFQANILGLNVAFGINLGVTRSLGKVNQWAWRIPIIAMQSYPLILLAFTSKLPESPRWYLYHGSPEKAKAALQDIYGTDEGKERYNALKESHAAEADKHVNYKDMLTPSHPQFHPTMLVIMGQINQALTGYGAVSVYGPQIFELLGFRTGLAEELTAGNFLSYFLLMTPAWLLIDAVGRRYLMVGGSITLTICFLLLALFSGLAYKSVDLDINPLAPAILGVVTLYIATGAFGIGWLATVWLIPTEIYPLTARSQGAAISVIIWGLANFGITLLTPIMFNNLEYWLFLVFAGTNAFAGLWTWLYSPETGGRSFEENQRFFDDAGKKGTWMVKKIEGGSYRKLPYGGKDAERTPLLQRVEDQLP